MKNHRPDTPGGYLYQDASPRTAIWRIASLGVMADWIFQANPRHHDLGASVTASREHWWGTPRYRDRMTVGDRVWLQVVGPKAPGIYYAATIVSRLPHPPAAAQV